MIIIKIKTWKDYKKDFINWVQAPRRKTCKEFCELHGKRFAKSSRQASC